LLSVEGQSDREPIPIKAFTVYGDASMATGLLNSGNKRLEQAAETWIERHGYKIFPFFGVDKCVKEKGR